MPAICGTKEAHYNNRANAIAIFHTGINDSNLSDIGHDLQDFLDFLDPGLRGQSGLGSVSFVALMVLFISVIVIGLVANSFVLLAALGKSRMRTAHNFFIATLASSDLFLCCVSLPIILWEVLFEEWPFSANAVFLCRCLAASKVLPLFTSSLSIVAIGWDRYRSLIQSDRQPFTTNHTFLIIVAIVFLSTLASSPPFFMAKIEDLIHFSEATNMRDILICRETWSPGQRLAYKISTSIFHFILPVILMVFVNVSIVIRLQKRPPSQHQLTNERRQRTNAIIITLICLFILSWLPLNVFNLLSELGCPSLEMIGLSGAEEEVYGILHLLGAASACFNPILYGYFNENFRQEYRSIYRKMPWHSQSLHSPKEVCSYAEADQNQSDHQPLPMTTVNNNEHHSNPEPDGRQQLPDESSQRLLPNRHILHQVIHQMAEELIQKPSGRVSVVDGQKETYL